MNKLLIPGPALQVLPELATEIGLHEAIITQQIWFWCLKSRQRFDDKPWIYNTRERWLQFFPFWSIDAIRRALRSAEDQGAILSRLNPHTKWDKTKWYTVNLEFPLFAGLDYPATASPVPSSEEPQEQPPEPDITEHANLHDRGCENARSSMRERTFGRAQTHDEYINKDTKQVLKESPLSGESPRAHAHAPAREQIPPSKPSPAKPKQSKTHRGTRWPDAETPVPDDWKAWGREQRPDLDIDQVAECFVDHWVAKAGSAGVKLDWKATWRNWVRGERKNPVSATHTGPGSNTKNHRNTRSIFDDDYASKDYQSGATRDEDLPSWARHAYGE